MKLIFLAFVFFAGFSTAVYMLGDAGQPETSSAKTEFIEQFNHGMHKCFEVAKTATVQATKLIKQKMDERQVVAKGE